MRHLILALMIALLPIRSWMGDAMAVAMLAAPTQHTTAVAQAGTGASPAHASHGAHADHADQADHASHANAHAQPATADVAMAHDAHSAHDAAPASTTGDHTHKSCEVCNGPAMPFALGTVPSPMPAPGMVVPPAERFASAEPQQGIKPPIS